MNFARIFVDAHLQQHPLVERARELFSPEKIEIVQGTPLASFEGELSPLQFDRSKRLLHITEFKGSFFKRCPGAKPGLTCCNYFVLNLGLQCNMNCSYCYLQSFINTPVTKVYTNIDRAFDELREIAKSAGDQALRVGTGEVIDSLSLDPLTLHSVELIQFFKNYPKWRVEFKTKSDLVDQFINVEHAGNVIVSWSLNPQNIISAEEHGTASLEARLSAARRCKDKGFQIAFHLDPVIWHPGWQASYKSLVDAITAQFSPEELPYISLGTLRFQPEQRHMMRERFGMSHVLRGEMFPGRDGKLRYDQALREEMFKKIMSWFSDHSKEWKIFLCMESPESWLNAVGSGPKHKNGLGELFDHNLVRKVEAALDPVRVE